MAVEVKELPQMIRPQPVTWNLFQNLGDDGAPTAYRRYLMRVPYACILTAVHMTLDTTIALHATDYTTFDIQKASTSMVTPITTETVFTAGTYRSFTPLTTSAIQMAAGDVISLVGTAATTNVGDLSATKCFITIQVQPL